MTGAPPGARPAVLRIAVCQKWVDHRPEVDQLTGAVSTDARTTAASAADQAALEWGLRAAEAWGGDVLVATAGPAGAEAMLRDGLAAGARRAVRADLGPTAPSEDAAATLAGCVAGADLVVCGDWSLDRGSGSVPAFLAARLGAPSALGCTHLDLDPGRPGQVRAERRLDGGRRERLVLGPPAVVSVEGGSARLRRASLAGVLGARTAAVDAVAGLASTPTRLPVRTGPFRPRPRPSPAPPVDATALERILALTGTPAGRQPPQLLVLDPAAAAERILGQLRAWGYLA